MALPFASARYPQPSSTVNTMGFVFLFIARQNTRIRGGLVVKASGEWPVSFRLRELTKTWRHYRKARILLSNRTGFAVGGNSKVMQGRLRGCEIWNVALFL